MFRSRSSFALFVHSRETSIYHASRHTSRLVQVATPPVLCSPDQYRTTAPHVPLPPLPDPDPRFPATASAIANFAGFHCVLGQLCYSGSNKYQAGPRPPPHRYHTSKIRGLKPAHQRQEKQSQGRAASPRELASAVSYMRTRSEQAVYDSDDIYSSHTDRTQRLGNI